MRPYPAFRGGLALLGLALALLYLWVAVSRVIYPYTLDLVEEGMLMQAWRVAGRHPVFAAPNADFVPQVYMPLYTWLSGLLLRLTGFAFWPLRALSLASTLVSSALLFVIGRRESHDSLVALWGAFIFLSGYRLVGGWYDLARVDTLFLVLTLAGMTTAVYAHDSNRGMLLSGLLMGLSLLAKQNGLLLAAVVGFYLWLAAPRKWWLYGLSFAATAAVPLFWLQISSDGWFSYYVVDIAYATPLEPRRLWHIFSGEILAGMGILGMFWGTAALRHWRMARIGPFLQSPWFLFIAVAVLISLAGRASVGGNLNNLIIGYGLLCLSPALLAKTLKEQDGAERPWLVGLLYLGLLAQFILNQFQPFGERHMTAIPSPQMRAAGQTLVQQLSVVEGEVLVMMHPSYAVMAGKQADVHIQSLWHARHRGHDSLPPDFIDRIEQQRYALIISDDSLFFEQDPALESLLAKHYRLRRRLSMTEAPATLSGLLIRPQLLYEPAQP